MRIEKEESGGPGIQQVRGMRKIAVLCAMAFWTIMPVSAQEVLSPDSNAAQDSAGILTIQSDVDSAVVFLDSTRVGVTPLVLRDVRPGMYSLKVVHPDLGNWLTGSITDSVEIGPGEEKSLRYAFERRFLVLSIPSGAEVVVQDSVRGLTPYLMKLGEQEALPRITLRKPGYDTAEVTLSDAPRGVKTVSLEKRWQPESGEETPNELASGDEGGALHIYLTGAATVLAGAAAAYFKIQADNKNSEYLRNLDPSLRSETRRLDTASALCLTASQVGFGLLAYFLLAE
jgi:hypothetical protein